MYKNDAGRIEWIEKRKRRRRRQSIMRISRFFCVMAVIVLFWAGVTAIFCREAEGGAGRETDGTAPGETVPVSASDSRGEKNEVYTEKVECILQNPELPTGCEVTAGTMLLRAYGYDAEKTQTAELLEKSERIQRSDGAFYGPHPDEAFIGDPASPGGFGVFPGPLAKALQKVIDSEGGVHTAKALYGLDERSILEYIDEGTPLCVWTSMYGKEIERRTGWYLIKDGEYTDEFFCWPSGEHCVVLTGYNDGEVMVCDPLEGECTYSRESFFRHYEQVGSYALVLE